MIRKLHIYDLKRFKHCADLVDLESFRRKIIAKIGLPNFGLPTPLPDRAADGEISEGVDTPFQTTESEP